MSASLVGSEMCIRDRFRGRPPVLAAPRHTRRRARLVRQGRSVVGCPAACLLYTSDAADDM
eukprot:12104556-Alexandrium_andersonii.AAC.1